MTMQTNSVLRDSNTEIMKSKGTSHKFSHVGEYDRFEDIMVDVNIHTSQVINLISSTDKHG